MIQKRAYIISWACVVKTLSSWMLSQETNDHYIHTLHFKLIRSQIALKLAIYKELFNNFSQNVDIHMM